MSKLQQNAAELASKGRYGDNRLLHVSDIELEGLASLVPGGKLPINPDTGLPEAFFFLPFLLGAAAPAAAGATAAAAPALAAGTAAGAGALGAGLTAGMEAATMGGLAAATAPTIAGTGALGLGAMTPTLTGAAGAAAPALAGAAPTVAAAAPQIAGSGALGLGAMTPALTGAEMATAAAPAAAAGKAAGLGGLFGGMNTGTALMSMAPLAMMMGGGGGGGGGGSKPDVSKVKYKGGEARFPGKNYKPGIDPEFSYFPRVSYLKDGGLVQNYAEGGLASLVPQEQMPLGEEGVPESSKEDAMLIQATVAAIQGQVPNAEAVVQQFVARFGEQALQDLVARIQQLPQQQGQQMMSDGRSDSIPANLSEGEYVIPADVVSGLGRGSTMAGARQLDNMSNQVRQMG